MDFDQALGLLKPLFENETVLKIGHNLKYDFHVLSRAQNGGTRLSPVDDTMCMSYVLDTGRVPRHSMDMLAEHWLGHKTIKYEDIYCVHVNGIVDYLGVVGNPHAADLTVNQVKGVVGSLVKKRKIYEVETNHFDTFK